MGAEKVISIVFETENKKKCCPNIISVITNSIGIMNHELANYELIGADYLLKIKTQDVSLLDIDEIDNLYNIGYVNTKAKIKEIKNVLK